MIKNIRFLSLLLCICMIFVLCSCEKVPEEESIDTNVYGEISEDPEVVSSETETSSEPITNESISHQNLTPEGEKVINEDNGDFATYLTYMGTCDYDGAYEFNNFSIDNSMTEMSIMIKVPEELSNIVTVGIFRADGVQLDSKESHIYSDSIRGMNGYVLMHLMVGDDVDLSNYKIKIVNGVSDNDYMYKDIPTTVNEIPEDAKSQLTQVEGKNYYYLGMEYVTEESGKMVLGKQKLAEIYYCGFFPIDCSSYDFPQKNITILLPTGYADRTLQAIDMQEGSVVDTYTLKTRQWYCMSISIVEMRYEYSESTAKSFIGENYYETFADILSNLELFINGNFITDL